MKQQFQVLVLALSLSAALVSCKENTPKESDPGFYFAVTSLDEWGNESAISNFVFDAAIMAPKPQTTIESANPFIQTRYSLNRSACQKIDGATPNVLRIKIKPEARPAQASADRGRVGVASVDALTSMFPGARFYPVFTSSKKTIDRHRAAGLDLWYTVVFDKQSAPDLRTAVAKYDALDEVQYVETVRPFKITEEDMGSQNVSTPSKVSPSTHAVEFPFNDPKLNMQWHYDNLGVEYDGKVVNPRASVNVFKAWQKNAGDRDVIVAITDQGVQFDHEDLKDAMWVNTGEIADNDIDDDDNGFVDDVYGYNFSPKMADDGSWLQPPYKHAGKIAPGSHGTHVAGTVGAVNNNGKGVCGIAGGSDGTGGVRLMCVQILGSDGAGDGSLIANAIVYSADNGAVISQNSWSMKVDEYTPSIQEAFTYFATSAGNKEMFPASPMVGGVIFAGAGNNNSPVIDIPNQFEEVMSVAATNHLRTKSDHSNSGVHIALSAPGGNFGGDSYKGSEVLGVFSTDFKNGYVAKSGTSMACPHVSGIAALIVSQNKGITAQQLRRRILSSCNDLSDTESGYKYMGAGLVDADKALRLNDNKGPVAITNLAMIKDNTGYTLSWTIPTDENDVVESYRVYYSKIPITDASIANLKYLKGQYIEKSGKNQKHVIE